MTIRNFSVKKKLATWTLEEIDSHFKIIKNDKVDNFIDKLMIDLSFSGNTINTTAFEDIMK